MSKCNILILENPASVANEICNQLRNIGFGIAGVVENISTLKERLVAQRPDLVLIGIHRRDEIDVAIEARRILQLVRIPVIFITGHLDAYLLKLLKGCDPNGYIIQPLYDSQLESHIEFALSKFDIQERLRESERQFRILAEQSPNIVLRIDTDFRCLYANPRIADLTGSPPESIIGKYFHEVGMPENACRIWKSIVEQTLANRRGVDQEFLFTFPQGSKILNIRTAPEFEDGVGVRSVIVTARDVTLQRQHETKIENLAQRLLYHVNNSPLAVIEWDSQGNCLSCNSEMEMLTGWSRHEIQQSMRNCLPLIHPEDRERFEQVQSRLSNGKEASAFVLCRTLPRDGDVLTCEWYLSSMLDDSGQSQSMLCFVSDVTARENAERELMNNKKQLESQVIQRTAELRQINRELIKEIEIRRDLEDELIKISEREHRRIGQDLHDGICQELAGIRFSLEAITKRMTNASPYKTTLASLTEGVARAIHHTRLLSRGLAPLDLQNGNLCHALREFSENSADLFQIDCVFECDGEDHPMEIDKATNLFRIAQEALQNAMKHADADRVIIRLNTSCQDGELSIADNGKGIPHKNNEPEKPTGMGLKIMSQRAMMIGGDLRIEQPQDCGTRIVCTFPN